MATDIPLKCDCGKVRGIAAEVSPANGNRMFCYCDDCQAFADFLGRRDTLDAHGGTDVYQMAPGRLRISDGIEHVACVQLGPKGLYRFYATCCRTPIGNMLPPFPFVGLVHSFMDHRGDGRRRDDVLGASRGYAHERFAVGGPPPQPRGASTLRVVLRVLALMLGWIVRGKTKPSPFFDATKKPIVEPKVLTETERANLRGARPTA